MTGASIPYQLRPNKFIDRQLFIELLSRIVVPRGPERYIYVSMGGPHLVDHHTVYNEFGIDAQYCFDQDERVVARQRFNRPTRKTICEKISASELPARLDGLFQKFRGKKNLVVWLDYTGVNRGDQFQEAVEVLRRLRHGDVFRITLNANPSTLCSGDEWKNKNLTGPGECRAKKLSDQLGSYFPAGITKISEHEVLGVLINSFGLAASAAEMLTAGVRFRPALTTAYRDGQQMLTITCVAEDTRANDADLIRPLNRWKFVSKNWSDCHRIKAPFFSAREQSRIEGSLHQGPKKLLRALAFLPDEDETKSLEALLSFKKFHRFHPYFRNVEK